MALGGAAQRGAVGLLGQDDEDSYWTRFRLRQGGEQQRTSSQCPKAHAIFSASPT